MEEFIMYGNLGLIMGAVVGLLVVIVYSAMTTPKVQKSGSYMTYENVIYKQVNQEELDNIIVLEVK